MNDIFAINSNVLKSNIKISKREVINQIKKKTEEAKLNMLKISLKENNILFDDNINDYHAFINNIRNKTIGRELAIANTLIENIDKSIDDIIDKLDKGSTSAFSDFVAKSYQRVIEPIGNMVTNSLALNTVISLIPTIEGKAIAGIVITGISIYKMSRIDKYKRMSNKKYELNKMLQEFEYTKDTNGNYTDTRFSKRIQDEIRKFLNESNIIFDDTGYLALREAIYKLDDDKKEQLCNIINNLKGNPIVVDERLKEFNQNLLTRIKNKYIKGMAIGGANGIAAATAINAIDPNILAAPLNGTIIGEIISNLSNSKVLGWIGGIASSGLSFISKYIPVIGESIQKILSIENLGVLAISGAGIGLLTTIGKSLIDAIKNRKKVFDTQKDMKKLQELDTKLYGKNDLLEIQEIKKILENKTTNEENFIVGMVCQYMDELGINYGKKPNNFQELNNIINNLSNKYKRKVNSLTSNLKEYLHREPNDFKRNMKKVGNILKTTITLGLASLSVVDILSSGVFLKGLKDKLFPEQESIIPSKMNAIDDSKGIEAYNESHENIVHEITPEPSHPVNEVVKPNPTPSPLSTPAPTQKTTSGMIHKKKNITGIATEESMKTSLVDYQNSIVRPQVDTKVDFAVVPKIKIDNLVIDPANNQELIEQLSTLTDKELFEVMVNGHDPEYMLKGLKLLNENDFNRLRTFIENSDFINRSNNPGYSFLKDAFNKYINEHNIAVDKIVDEINRKMELLKNTDMAVKGLGVPAVLLSEYEEKNQMERQSK